MDPAGYVLYYRGENRDMMFKFETTRERHLCLNILTRFASTYVQNQQLKRTERKYSDQKANMGVSGDSPAAVIEAIRARRKERRATIGYSDAPLVVQSQADLDQKMVDQIVRLRSQTR